MKIADFSGRWNRFWFKPVAPEGLGFCRVLFFGWLFIWYWSFNFSAIGFHPVEFWRPIFFLQVFRLDAMPSPELMWILGAVWKTSLLLACVGLLTRTSILVGLLCGTYILATTHSFGKINHSDAALLFAMGILFVSRCGDAFSIDRLLKRVRNATVQDGIVPSGEYHWPIQMIRIVLVIVFFAAGISKVSVGGLEWILSDNFATILVRSQLMWEPPLSIGTWIASYGWLCVILALGTVVFELAAPLALFSRLARMIIIPGLLGMQIGIRLVMADVFTQFMALYLFWVPWALVGAWLAREKFLPQRQVVLFDGGCGICRRTVAVLTGLDVFKRISFLDIVQEWPAVMHAYPHLTQAQCLQNMHVETSIGENCVGFYAYRSLMKALPLGWFVLPFLYLPGVPWAGNQVYRFVSERRLRNGCSMGSGSACK